jgi:hypothetical protein
LFTAPTGGIDCTGVPSDETHVALLQDVLARDPSNTSLADYVNNFAEQHNVTQPEINDAVALLQTGSYNFSPTELARSIRARQHQPRVACPVYQWRDPDRPELPHVFVEPIRPRPVQRL